MGADHTNDAGAVAQCQLGGYGRAGARALANGHVHHVQIGHCLEQLPPVGGHAAQQVNVKAGHHVGTTLGGQVYSVLAAFLKVGTVFDQRHTQGAHGGVLLS